MTEIAKCAADRCGYVGRWPDGLCPMHRREAIYRNPTTPRLETTNE